MQSDTPRTDAESWIGPSGDRDVAARFAQRLERELAAAIKERDGYLEGNKQTLRALEEANEIAKRYKRERDDARRWLRDACAEIARIETRFYDALSPQQIAERNGWQCFAQQEGGGA